MVLSQTNTAGMVLESLTKIEAELAKLNAARVEQHEATVNLDKELQETLDVLVNNFDLISLEHKRIDCEEKIQ